MAAYNHMNDFKANILPKIMKTMKDHDQAIAASQATDLDIAGNILKLKKADGTTVGTGVDLSLYLDDTNLARMVSGVLDPATGILTVARDDNSTFTIDLSPLLDDTSVLATDADFTAGTATDKAPTVKQIRDKFVSLLEDFHPLKGDASLEVVGKDAEEGTQQFVTANQFVGSFTQAEADQAYVDA